MFPFQRSCELSFKNDDGADNIIEEDQIMFENNALVEVGNINLDNNNNNNINRGRGRGRGRGRNRGRRSASLAGSSSTNNNIEEDEEEKKRVFHRDIERQRRIEMSSLFDSLRSVIPSQLFKGRKSITDHLEEATNYIKDLEKNVKELGEKRDQLKHSIGSTSRRSANETGSSSDSLPPYTMAIRQFVGGFEIEICVKFDEEFLLSTALQIAFEEGLEVVSCTSTKSNDRLIHSIQCEVNDITVLVQIDLNIA